MMNSDAATSAGRAGTTGVCIVGRGKLAQELLHGLDSPGISQVLPWDERAADTRCLVVHAGSGRELPDVIAFCTATGSMLLELSTAGSRFPDTVAFPLVLCPNVNMQMLAFMAMVRQAAGYFRGQDMVLTESHQASKATLPGTALHMARSLGIPERAIRSVRDPQLQQEQLGIPAEFLDRHAYHEIRIHNPDVEIRLETKVLGKSAYAHGLARVIEIVSRSALPAGCHDIVDLVIRDMAAGSR